MQGWKSDGYSAWEEKANELQSYNPLLQKLFLDWSTGLETSVKMMVQDPGSSTVHVETCYQM